MAPRRRRPDADERKLEAKRLHMLTFAPVTANLQIRRKSWVSRTNSLHFHFGTIVATSHRPLITPADARHRARPVTLPMRLRRGLGGVQAGGGDSGLARRYSTPHLPQARLRFFHIGDYPDAIRADRKVARAEYQHFSWLFKQTVPSLFGGLARDARCR